MTNSPYRNVCYMCATENYVRASLTLRLTVWAGLTPVCTADSNTYSSSMTTEELAKYTQLSSSRTELRDVCQSRLRGRLLQCKTRKITN